MIGKWKAAALRGLPTLFDEKRNADAVKAKLEAELQESYEQVGRLSDGERLAEKNLVSGATTRERRTLVGRDSANLSVVRQAELLEINRRMLYYVPKHRVAQDVVIKNRIDEIYTKRPFYGSRRIKVELRKQMAWSTAKRFSATCEK